jgi:hypothetical protein
VLVATINFRAYSRFLQSHPSTYSSQMRDLTPSETKGSKHCNCFSIDRGFILFSWNFNYAQLSNFDSYIISSEITLEHYNDQSKSIFYTIQGEGEMNPIFMVNTWHGKKVTTFLLMMIDVLDAEHV